MKIFSIFFIFFSLTAQGFAQGVNLPAGGDIRLVPEVTTKVGLSNKDVNRIMCPSPIADVVYSKEKGLKVHFTKKDAFFKWEVIKINDQIHYASIPTEVYITCGDSVYHMIAIPENIPSRTVRLSNGASKTIEANRSFLRGLPFEEKVLKLIKAVYTDTMPNSFTIQTFSNAISLYRNIDLTHIRTISVDGEGLLIKEFIAKTKNVTTQIQIKEKDFLNSKLAVRPLGITIDKLTLKPGEAARILIVERRGGESNG